MSSSEQEQIYQMFDRIAPTYDAVNRLLSFGLDLSWRKKLCECLPENRSLTVLDIATGTADLLIAMCEKRPNIKEAVGIDLAANMLSIAHKKIAKDPSLSHLKLIRADGAKLPFASLSFDVVSIAFGIRNIVDQRSALGEMMRVLKPQGLALVLEFSLPTSFIIRPLYLAYFRHILPLIGGIMSREVEAYRYLNRTVEQFPSPKEFSKRFLEAGFSEVSLRSLNFGIATIYSARKS